MTPKTPRVGRPRATPEADVTREDSVEDVILSAARNLFRTQGFSATTTREIAAAAGLRQPSMFHYFPNKMAMLEAVALARRRNGAVTGLTSPFTDTPTSSSAISAPIPTSWADRSSFPS